MKQPRTLLLLLLLWPTLGLTPVALLMRENGSGVETAPEPRGEDRWRRVNARLLRPRHSPPLHSRQSITLVSRDNVVKPGGGILVQASYRPSHIPPLQQILDEIERTIPG